MSATADKVIIVHDHKIMCNGGGGALGHPKTYYVIGDEGCVVCKYCDRKFVLDTHHHDDIHDTTQKAL